MRWRAELEAQSRKQHANKGFDNYNKSISESAGLAVTVNVGTAIISSNDLATCCASSS